MGCREFTTIGQDEYVEEVIHFLEGFLVEFLCVEILFVHHDCPCNYGRLL